MLVCPEQSYFYRDQLDGGSVLYGPGSLKPDGVTAGLAYVASKKAYDAISAAGGGVKTIQERQAVIAAGETVSKPEQTWAELGGGTAAFLSWLARGVKWYANLELIAVDTDEAALPYANYNLIRALEGQSEDRFHIDAVHCVDVRKGSWDEILHGDKPLDGCYFNPPYLLSGDQVREDYTRMPHAAMFVEGDDPLVHYRSVLPRLPRIMKAGGLAVVRTPREQDQYAAVHALMTETMSRYEGTIHEARYAEEVLPGMRQGGGLIVEFATVKPRLYTIEPLRTQGLAMKEQSLVGA